MCLTTDVCLTADPGVESSIPAHTLLETDHEIISIVIFLPSADSRTFVRYNRKDVQEVLLNGLVKLAQEKVWLGELTVLTCP